MSLLVFSPSLCRLLPFHWVLCHSFKAMLLVGIYPNEASFVAYMYTTVVIVLFLNQQKTSQQVIFGPKKSCLIWHSHNAFADFFFGWRDSPLSRSISTGITMRELQSIWQATQITFNLLQQLQLIRGRFKSARKSTFFSSALVLAVQKGASWWQNSLVHFDLLSNGQDLFHLLYVQFFGDI